MLAMRLARDEESKQAQCLPSQPRAISWNLGREIISRMLIKPADRTEACNQQIEQEARSSAHEREGNEIRQHDLEEEIRRAHITGAERLGRPRRMMDAVPERAHQAWLMQNEAVENILDDIVANAHESHRGEKMQNRHVRGPGKSKPGGLQENHRRKQDEDLIDKHARKELPVAPPLVLAHLEGRKRARAVGPFEGERNAMIDNHLDRPGQDRKRQPPGKIGRQQSLLQSLMAEAREKL